jgi:hypothetical protein
VILTEPVAVTRLTFVTQIDAEDWRVLLSRPVLLHVGEQLWVDGTSVQVRHADGSVTAHQGEGFWLCRRLD